MSPSVIGGAGHVDGGGVELAADPAGGNRNHDGLKLHRRGALGEIDGVTNRSLGLGEVDDGAALDAARFGVTDAEDFDAVAPAPQHFLRILRLEPRDQADDLAGADVEHGDDRRTARRHRLHLRREAIMEAHASPPLRLGFGLRASARAL